MSRTIATSTQTGIRLHGTDSPVTVLTGVTVNSSGTSHYGLYALTPSPVSVRNLGRVQGTHVGVLLAQAGTIINGSAIDSSASISGAIGIEVFDGGAVVRNLGNVGGTIGIYLLHGGTVTNGTKTDHAANLYDSTTGVSMAGHGTVVNNAALTTYGRDSRGVAMSAGGAVVNGLGNAAALLYAAYGYGVAIGGGTGVVTNGGTIEATGRYETDNLAPGHYDSGTAVLLGAGGTVTSGMDGHAAATIMGTYVGVDIAGGPGEVRNGGQIHAVAHSYYEYTDDGLIATVGIGVTLADGGSVANGAVGDSGALIDRSPAARPLS